MKIFQTKQEAEVLLTEEDKIVAVGFPKMHNVYKVTESGLIFSHHFNSHVQRLQTILFYRRYRRMICKGHNIRKNSEDKVVTEVLESLTVSYADVLTFTENKIDDRYPDDCKQDGYILGLTEKSITDAEKIANGWGTEYYNRRVKYSIRGEIVVSQDIYDQLLARSVMRISDLGFISK